MIDKNTPIKKYYLCITGILLLTFTLNPFLNKPFANKIGLPRLFKISSGSMMPTLEIGDQILADMLYYKTKKPKRSDIVIYNPPHDKNNLYIHRCIAIENDKIEMKNGFLYINNKKVKEKYTIGLTFDEKDEPIKVPKNSIFLLGDNRENAMDSRYFGSLPINKIAGKAILIYLSKNKTKINGKL